MIVLLNERFERWQRAGRIRDGVPAETLAFEFIAVIAMTRFIYFNIAAGRAEAARGREVVKRHVETFLALLEPRSTSEESR